MRLAHDRDVLLAKVSTVRQCLKAIETVRERNDGGVEDWMVMDVTVLNLQRAIQAIIDIAQHLLAKNGLPLPRDSADCFVQLQRAGHLDAAITKTLIGMVGFRNIAVHRYTEVDVAVVDSIVENHLADFRAFLARIAERTLDRSEED